MKFRLPPSFSPFWTQSEMETLGCIFIRRVVRMDPPTTENALGTFPTASLSGSNTELLNLVLFFSWIIWHDIPLLLVHFWVKSMNTSRYWNDMLKKYIWRGVCQSEVWHYAQTSQDQGTLKPPQAYSDSARRFRPVLSLITVLWLYWGRSQQFTKLF